MIEHRELGRRYDRSRRRVRHLVVVDERHVEMRSIVARRAGKDAVVVVRKDLRFLESLMSAGGAAREVGVIRRSPIKSLHQDLARDGHLVSGPRSEVQPFVGMSDERCPVGHGGGHRPHIGVRNGVATNEPGCQRAVTNAARVPTSTGALITAGPGVGRHPNLDPNTRIGGWRNRERHTAEGRQVADWRTDRRGERAGRYRLRSCYRREGNFQRTEAFARGGECGGH